MGKENSLGEGMPGAREMLFRRTMSNFDMNQHYFHAQEAPYMVHPMCTCQPPQPYMFTQVHHHHYHHHMWPPRTSTMKLPYLELLKNHSATSQ